MAEVSVLAAEQPGPGEARIKPSEAPIGGAGDRELARQQVTELELRPWRGQSLAARGRPETDPPTEDGARRAFVKWHVADDDISTLGVRAGMLGEHPRVCCMSSVQEQKELTARHIGAGIAGRRCAPILLLDHRQRELDIEPPQRIGGTVAGAVVNNDHLEVPLDLSSEQGHIPGDHLAPLIRRDDDAETSHVPMVTKRHPGVSSAWTTRRAAAGAAAANTASSLVRLSIRVIRASRR